MNCGTRLIWLPAGIHNQTHCLFIADLRPVLAHQSEADIIREWSRCVDMCIIYAALICAATGRFRLVGGQKVKAA